MISRIRSATASAYSGLSGQIEVIRHVEERLAPEVERRSEDQLVALGRAEPALDIAERAGVECVADGPITDCTLPHRVSRRRSETLIGEWCR